MNYHEVFVSSLVGAFAAALVAAIGTLLKIVLQIREQVARLGQKLDDHIAASTNHFKRAAVLAALAFLLTGCAGIRRYTPFVYQTNVIERVTLSTNLALPAVTNYTTNIVVEVAPAVDSIVSTVRQVNAAVPSPVSPFLELGLLALTATLGWFARLKTVQAQRRQAMLQTVIAGVEARNDVGTKEAIDRASVAAGVRAELDGLVQKITR